MWQNLDQYINVTKIGCHTSVFSRWMGKWDNYRQSYFLYSSVSSRELKTSQLMTSDRIWSTISKCDKSCVPYFCFQDEWGIVIPTDNHTSNISRHLLGSWKHLIVWSVIKFGVISLIATSDKVACHTSVVFKKNCSLW
jgi:hypothetical protein